MLSSSTEGLWDDPVIYIQNILNIEQSNARTDDCLIFSPVYPSPNHQLEVLHEPAYVCKAVAVVTTCHISTHTPPGDSELDNTLLLSNIFIHALISWDVCVWVCVNIWVYKYLSYYGAVLFSGFSIKFSTQKSNRATSHSQVTFTTQSCIINILFWCLIAELHPIYYPLEVYG